MHVNKSRKSAIVLALAVLLVVSAVSAYAYVTSSQETESKSSDNSTTKPTSTTPASGNSAKDNPKTNEDTYSRAKPDPKVDNIELSATQDDSNTVTIVAKLYGASDGTCDVAVSNGAKKVSKTAEVIYQPAYSTCAGFSVEKDELGPGTWNIKLVVSSGSNTYSETASVEVK